MHDRSGRVPERAEEGRMKQSSKATIEQAARKQGARRTAMVFGAIAVAIFLLSLLQGLQYS